MQCYVVLFTNPQSKAITEVRVRAETPMDALTIAQALYARISAHERN